MNNIRIKKLNGQWELFIDFNKVEIEFESLSDIQEYIRKYVGK